MGMGIGLIVRDSWRRQLAPENIAHARLVHEIEGLAAAARFARAGFDVGGLVPRQGIGRGPVTASFLNSAYSGLQAGFFNSGERERVEVVLDPLCALAGSWTVARAGRIGRESR
jgi:hypothetical protein